MVKKINDLTDALMSIGKAIPLILGAVGGVLVEPTGGVAPINAIKMGNAGYLADGLLANYTFYSMGNREFSMVQGKGVKLLAAGMVIHKIFGWLID